MKVKISTTLNIDPKAWAEEFGIDPDDNAAIREDVKTYFEGTCQDQLTTLDLALDAPAPKPTLPLFDSGDPSLADDAQRMFGGLRGPDYRIVDDRPVNAHTGEEMEL